MISPNPAWTLSKPSDGNELHGLSPRGRHRKRKDRTAPWAVSPSNPGRFKKLGALPAGSKYERRNSPMDPFRKKEGTLQLCHTCRLLFNYDISLSGLEDAMKRLIPVAVAAAAFGFIGSANAADLPVKAPVYKAPPAIISWTGFYLGLQAGYGWGDPTYHYLAAASSNSFRTDGFVGGATLGYNWQTGPLVLGLEGDFSFADVKGSLLLPHVIANTPCINEGCTAKMNWFGTGRVRLGYAIGDLMPFVTGGAAVGHIEGSADLGACGGSVCGFDETRWGWTVGGGLEYRFAPNWSAKVEYLYMNLGTPSFTAPTVTSDDFAYNIVRGGINVHF